MGEKQLILNFKYAYQQFPQQYQSDFDSFWLWRRKVESPTEHILDNHYIDRTFRRLSPILKRWQYNRGPKSNEKHLDNLRIALNNISEEYSTIRNRYLYNTAIKLTKESEEWPL